jgi:hypothetical protein
MLALRCLPVRTLTGKVLCPKHRGKRLELSPGRHFAQLRREERAWGLGEAIIKSKFNLFLPLQIISDN